MFREISKGEDVSFFRLGFALVILGGDLELDIFIEGHVRVGL